MRRAAKIDANQPEIVAALEAAGCTVQSLAGVGEGCPDLLVGVNQWNVLMEIKDGSRPVSERAFKPKQKTWHRDWRGTAHVVETVEQALQIVGAYRGRGRPTGD